MISIVIPVLNEEALLSDCLRSLRDQDYPGQYEIIVVDNGSTDRSVSIAREFGATVILSPTHSDVFTARDLGARASRGEIVAQADADTVYPRDWLTRIAKHLSSHPEAVAVAGTFVYRTPTPWSKAEFLLKHIVNILTIRLFGRSFLISGANFAFRKKAFSSVNGYDKKSYAPDQYGISTRLSKVGKIIYDKNISVATSPRRFQKPLPLILIALAFHLYQYFEHFLKGYAGSLQTAHIKLLPTRTFVKLLPLVLLLSFVAYGYFIPASPVFGKVYYKGNTLEKVVALTLDDGPNEPYTSQILDILATYGIEATFFTTGRNVELYPEIAKRIIAEGHILGNHSYTHMANHALTTQGSEDIKLAQNTIFKIVGLRPHLYRPPHGKKSPWELQYLKSENMIEVTWSVSTEELNARPAELVAQDILKKTKPGGIILLHDGYGNDHNSPEADKTLTVKVLPIIIESLQDKGYKFVTVPELLGVPAYNYILQ